MKIQVKEKIEELMALHEIPYCIYIDSEGVRREFGAPDTLESPDFPKTLFYDLAAEKSMYEYLQSNLQPRMLSQGSVRSILGTLEKETFALFLNSSLDIIEYHKFAKHIHASIKGASGNET